MQLASQAGHKYGPSKITAHNANVVPIVVFHRRIMTFLFAGQSVTVTCPATVYGLPDHLYSAESVDLIVEVLCSDAGVL